MPCVHTNISALMNISKFSQIRDVFTGSPANYNHALCIKLNIEARKLIRIEGTEYEFVFH